MYVWTLVGHEIRQANSRSGCGTDLAAIMRHAEPFITSREVFACRIVEVVPRISVIDLDTETEPTGRVWLGRRTTSGGVRWVESFEPPELRPPVRWPPRTRSRPIPPRVRDDR